MLKSPNKVNNENFTSNHANIPIPPPKYLPLSPAVPNKNSRNSK